LEVNCTADLFLWAGKETKLLLASIDYTSYACPMKHILISILLLFLVSCDTKKDKVIDNYQTSLLCFSYGICPSSSPGTKFGMIGDSWTDLAVSLPLIEALRLQLEKYHGYKITGATLGGRTLQEAEAIGLHKQIIDTAGPDLKYMLISLGGNDLQYKPSAYLNNMDVEKQSRFSAIRNIALKMVREGNAYKILKWGGSPLIWFFHGYDYSNPDNIQREDETSCRSTLNSAGFVGNEVEKFSISVLDDFNTLLYNLSLEEPQIRYIDLRNTLGGPPSPKSLMFDCIHPNSNGFRLLGERYVNVLKGYTNNER
jgi:hypothetical protein